MIKQRKSYMEGTSFLNLEWRSNVYFIAVSFLISCLLPQKAPAVDFVDTATINQTELAAGWSGQAFIYNSDVWIRSYFNGAGKFDYRIGAGGAIAEMRSVETGYQHILPSWPEVTDRVVQSVWWDGGILSPVASPDSRYNLDQAGGISNQITPTISVRITNSPVPQVDVYSTPQDQWYVQNRPYIRAKASYLTRYRLIGEGNLMVRRIMMIDQPYVVQFTQQCDYECYPVPQEEVSTPHVDLYVEAWTPFKIANSNPGFTNLAFALNPDGSPAWWYNTGWNIPTYPYLSVSNTYGYAVAYKALYGQWSTAVGVVFGTEHPKSYHQNIASPYGTYVLNSLEQEGTLAILPALLLGNAEAGAIIDQYLVLVPKTGLDYTMYNNLQQMLSLVPSPRFYPANSVFEGELAQIVTNVRANMLSSAGVRTDHLASLVVW